MDNTRLRKINDNITKGSLKSSLWKLAGPMIASALLHDLFSLVDLFFVGRLGYVAVAALSICGVIIAIIMMMAIGISTGTTALVAHFTGKKDYLSADNVLFQTIAISVICSLVMVFTGIFGTTWLLRIFGATPEIIPVAYGYLKISFVWSIFIFLFIGFTQSLRGSGDVVVPLKILLFANLLNIVLDPLFIFGVGFFPKMGVTGSAVATVISQAAGVVVILAHLIFGHSTLHFNKRAFRINFPVIGRMVRIGFFASFEVLLRQVSLLLLVRLVASFGAAALAAFGIALRLRMAVMMVGMGMGIATAVLIGQNMGAGQPQRAMQSGKDALKYYQLIVIPAAVLFFIFAPQVIGIFNNHPEVIKIGTSLLRFVAVTLPFLASALILGRGMTGAGDTIAPATMTGVTQLGLRIPIAYILALAVGMGTNGIWLGINASDVVQGVAMFWYFRKGFWQKRYHKHRAILEEAGPITIA
ncbi:MAG: MATE family efflux transporter [Candidatus Omnitrophica bacterium]|nr:MATE family efflux transporter [Candidatus Omnitrophota bacterium]